MAAIHKTLKQLLAVNRPISAPLRRRTHSHITFITPSQFDSYSRLGYVVFMSNPTQFGTYKAVKISLIEE